MKLQRYSAASKYVGSGSYMPVLEKDDSGEAVLFEEVEKTIKATERFVASEREVKGIEDAGCKPWMDYCEALLERYAAHNELFSLIKEDD